MKPGDRVTWMATEPSHCHGKPNRKRAREALVLATTRRSVKITTPDRWPGNATWVRRANVVPARGGVGDHRDA